MRIERVIRRRLRVDDNRQRLVFDLDATVAANVKDGRGGPDAAPSAPSGPTVTRTWSRIRIVQRGRSGQVESPATQEDTHE